MLFRSARPRPNVLQSAHLPAPVGGLNMVVPASAMNPGDCLTLNNMIGSKYGLRVRPGYREWCTALGDPVEDVRSILSFAGSSEDGTADKLFACTQTGIWDVTTSSATPSQVYTFPTQNADSGFGVGTSFVTAAGHFYLYCDEANGYLTYTQSTDTWALIAEGAGAGEISGVDPRKLAFVTAWKTRVLFVERDTASMWYLEVGAITGAVTEFDFGNKFRYGGPLVGLWNWTIDGGSGVDDLLVAASRGGDIAVYAGTDPSDSAAFAQKGMWFVGGVPAGRRIATDFGGDILLLSYLGVIPLSKLLSGGDLASPDSYATNRIAPIFTDAMVERKHLRGWEIRIHPEDSTLIVGTPTWTGQPQEQFVMSLSSASKGWGRYLDLPITCAESWKGKLYFGTTDGRVCINDGVFDNISRDGSADNASDVEFSLLSAFSAFGGIHRKRLQFVRPIFRVNGADPSYLAEARWDFNESEISDTLPAVVSSGALWDVAVWDVDVWGAGLRTQSKTFGSTGFGTHLGIALKGACHAETILIGFDVAWDNGGVF
jgi:hypothetical protein